MKELIVAAAAAVMLTGCEQQDEPPSQQEEAQYIEDQAAASTRQQLAADQADLKQTVEELRKKDPTVKDAYFTYNEKGEKELNIVREEANGGSSSSVWPLLAGAATGYAVASMMNSRGGYSGYAASNPPRSYQSYADEDDRRRRMNSSSAAYTSTMMNNNRSAVRSSPNFRSSMSKSVISSRSSGVFAGSTGARGGAHATSSGS